MVARFTVPGVPVGKGRPRKGKDGKMHTPQKTRDYEDTVRAYYVYTAKGVCFRDRALSLVVRAYYPLPKSMTERERELIIKGELRPCVTPDGDNVLKVIADALNGVAYDDDRCIVSWHLVKLYSEEPRVDVEIGDVM